MLVLKDSLNLFPSHTVQTIHLAQLKYSLIKDSQAFKRFFGILDGVTLRDPSSVQGKGDLNIGLQILLATLG